MNIKGEPALVGKHCGSNIYTIDKETVAFYQSALGDEHPLHERYAPPLLHHSECYEFVGEWYLANLFGNLHGQQDWSMFAPIPVGSRVRTRSTIIDRYSRRGRDWVVNETDLLIILWRKEGLKGAAAHEQLSLFAGFGAHEVGLVYDPVATAP